MFGFHESRWSRPWWAISWCLRIQGCCWWCNSSTSAARSHGHPLFSLGPRLVVKLVSHRRAAGHVVDSICHHLHMGIAISIGDCSSICDLLHLVIEEFLRDQVLLGQDAQAFHKGFIDIFDFVFLDTMRPMIGGRTWASFVAGSSTETWG